MKYTLAFLFVAATSILMISAPSPPFVRQLNSVLGRARQLAEDIRRETQLVQVSGDEKLRLANEFVEVSDIVSRLAEQTVAIAGGAAQGDSVLGQIRSESLPSLEIAQQLVQETGEKIVAWLPRNAQPQEAQSIEEIRSAMRLRAQQLEARLSAGEIDGVHILPNAQSRAQRLRNAQPLEALSAEDIRRAQQLEARLHAGEIRLEALSAGEIRTLARLRSQQLAARLSAGEIDGVHILNAARTRRWN